MMYVLLIVGFILLIKGADFFVDGASSTAKLLKVPSVIIGLTIVAMGTSAPEAAVSISAGLSGSSDIALSNVIGSNIFNLLIVVGVSAIICPMKTEKVILRRDIWWSLGAAAATLIMMTDMKISGAEGILLLGGMAAYIAVLVFDARKKRDEGDEVKAMSPLKSIIYIVGGLAAIIIGGDLVVDSACDIAAAFGMSEALIGLTIVAAGTSLPELVTSIVAAKKGDSGLALGNVVGSNIFNILFILGSASALTTINVAPELFIDTAILIAVTLLMYFLCRTKEKTSRGEGALCVLVYAAYMAYIILR
ncbi:MAG: calcium/sodium antiporter [Oscillospiraceae bacterium]|nr:calcium/sodium antiporter [Oscillospiraceae bacterium]